MKLGMFKRMEDLRKELIDDFYDLFEEHKIETIEHLREIVRTRKGNVVCIKYIHQGSDGIYIADTYSDEVYSLYEIQPDDLAELYESLELKLNKDKCVICANCKAIHYNGIIKCMCGGQTFEKTDPRNEIYILDTNQDIYPETHEKFNSKM